MTLAPGDAAASALYDESFYQNQQDGSATSAQVVVPLFLSHFPCRSVVDFGCGVGSWLKEFEHNGISDYLGVDGDYVPRHLLRIPADRFLPQDLGGLSDLGREFDAACSLEVAEHLPQECAASFVAALVKAAPVILFSAAIPFQGGTGHLNEQWQSYWARLFAEHGYLPLDLLRPVIFGDRRVEWWYRQNILVFCPPSKCPLRSAAVSGAYDLDRVDPQMVANLVSTLHAQVAATKKLLDRTSALTEAVMARRPIKP
ncbi:MAG TPA: methyltransferase domain-containing protein [Methylocella sp.]|nr:methyltransferase domain-containing protein [Methylocella sp.]